MSLQRAAGFGNKQSIVLTFTIEVDGQKHYTKTQHYSRSPLLLKCREWEREREDKRMEISNNHVTQRFATHVIGSKSS